MGFFSEKGTQCLHDDGATAVSVAGYLVFGGNDETPGAEAAIKGAFERNRARGAPWAYAVEPGAGHTIVRNLDLLFNWLNDVTARRLPDISTPGAPLRSLDERSGWLGEMNAYAIGSWTCYTANRLAASWFPSERTAKDWQGMISRGATTTVIPCGP